MRRKRLVQNTRTPGWMFAYAPCARSEYVGHECALALGEVRGGKQRGKKREKDRSAHRHLVKYLRISTRISGGAFHSSMYWFSVSLVWW